MAGPSEWPEKKKMIVTAVVAGVVNLGMIGFLFKAWSNHNAIVKSADGIKAEAKKVQDSNEQNKGKPDEYERLNKESESLVAQMPSDKQVTEVMDKMSKLAAMVDKAAKEGGGTGGCENKKITPVTAGSSKDQASQQAMRDVFKTTWDADFMSWCKLMNLMEEGQYFPDLAEDLKFKRFVTFENLTIRPRNSGMIIMGDKHSISVDVVTYRYKPPPGS